MVASNKATLSTRARGPLAIDKRTFSTPTESRIAAAGKNTLTAVARRDFAHFATQGIQLTGLHATPLQLQGVSVLRRVLPRVHGARLVNALVH